jgi:hypothetical protein
MKQHSYKLLTATACGSLMTAFGSWSAAMIYDAHHTLGIVLAIPAIFLWFAMRIQIQDRKIALIRDNWSREAQVHQAQISNL